MAVKLDKVVPFLLESKLIERGAIFEKSGLWQPHVVTDQRVVTGQNPQSAKAVGEAVLSALKQQQAVARLTRYEVKPEYQSPFRKMKTINQIAGGIIIMLAMNNAEAQTNTNELAVINQLSTQSAVVNMPVSKLLNAPGNEALKAFFFTPVKNRSALKGKKIAVLVADGFRGN